MKKRNRLIISFILIILLGLSGCQKNNDESESFKKYGQEFEGKITKSYQDSKEWWPETLAPPKDAPNVIIFLLDDVGFAQVGCLVNLRDAAGDVQRRQCNPRHPRQFSINPMDIPEIMRLLKKFTLNTHPVTRNLENGISIFNFKKPPLQ